MEDLNDTIKNLKEMIEKRGYIINCKQDAIRDCEEHIKFQDKKIAELEEKHKETVRKYCIEIDQISIERDAFKEALKIIVRKGK